MAGPADASRTARSISAVDPHGSRRTEAVTPLPRAGATLEVTQRREKDSMSTRPHTHLRPALRRVASLIFVAAFAVAIAADGPRIESAWVTEAPTIDGKLPEWTSLVSLDPAKLSAGVHNNDRFIYVAITASDQPTRTLLASAGFTLWLDPAGKHNKAFGITIPPIMAGWSGMRGRGPGGPPDAEGPGGPPPERQAGTPEQGRGILVPIRHIEVSGSSKDDRRRLELDYARRIGIDVAATQAEGVLVYEIRLPLSASLDQPYAVRSVPGAVVSLGIETGKVERPEGPDRAGGRGSGGGTGGGPGGGGIGGIGGGMGGRRGGGMGGGMMGGGPPGSGRGGMSETKPIRVWTVVQLAAGPR
jgi:hypothetical protein